MFSLGCVRPNIKMLYKYGCVEQYVLIDFAVVNLNPDVHLNSQHEKTSVFLSAGSI
jgi:hypothetical protein